LGATGLAFSYEDYTLENAMGDPGHQDSKTS
jgi:hypothetical protein